MKIIYLTSTYWDREWYLPFQNYRFELVKTVIDKLTVDKDKCVFKTNLAEKNLTEITVTNGNAEIIAKPNEIITLRIK